MKYEIHFQRRENLYIKTGEILSFIKNRNVLS